MENSPQREYVLGLGIDFGVDVQGMMNIRVAAIVDDSTVVEREHRDLEAWNNLGEALLQKTVELWRTKMRLTFL